MQIRLTILASRGGQAAARPCDVLVSAPAGTVLAAVTDALATTAAAATGGAGGTDHGHETVPVFAGTERLDPQRQVLGAPPLVDGAVLSLYGPSATAPVPPHESAIARLHVVAGPDAGGVHLLRGGRVSIGRSADADVPLDDPDVSRLHCAVTVTDDGTVTVTDLDSTNGTTLDGAAVDGRPALLPPGVTLRVGESAVRLETPAPGELPPVLPTDPDGDGHLRVGPASGPGDDVPGHGPGGGQRGDTPAAGAPGAGRNDAPDPAGSGPGGARGAAPASGGTAGIRGRAAAADPHGGPTTRGGSPAGAAYAQRGTAEPGHGAEPRRTQGTGDTTAAGRGSAAPHRGAGADAPASHGSPAVPFPQGETTHGAGTVLPGMAENTQRRRGRGIGAWARRLTAVRDDAGEVGETGPPTAADAGATPADPAAWDARWPDPASVLLTALGPGPRLWERGPEHPEALTLRLGSAHRSDQTGEPVTVDLREAGSLGLAGPRSRLAALARSLLAQLTALHAPGDLEIVLLAADRAREVQSRTEEWGWLGWLPHLRPSHGQDCRLLLAYDREQATARTAELTRRLHEIRREQHATAHQSYDGPRTVLVVDGDPGSASLREDVTWLAEEGTAAGIHVLCLAQTPPATPASPLDATLKAACAASAPFRACGALALLSGAVATAVRLVRQAPAQARGTDATVGGLTTTATLDGVSAAWAERFAHALAPLREADSASRRAGASPPSHRAVLPLPQTCRLLDELELARATPSSVLTRWMDAHGGGGPVTAPPVGAGVPPLVLGAGPRGVVGTDPAHDRAPVLLTGAAGTGKTELLRSVAASLAASARPDRLALLLVDGDGDAVGPRRTDGGLGVCADLPHVDSHLVADDPLRMREFAQALGAELKRRTELLGASGSFDEQLRLGAGQAGTRVVAPRRSPDDPSRSPSPDAADGGHPPAGTLPRLVVIVDDLDTLVDPALGNPGRPAAGSVVRALESVAREGAPLGVHLIAATGHPDRTADTAAARGAAVRVELTGRDEAEDAVPGRGRVRLGDGSVTEFQAARITGRIPRTATLRPTVVPLDWARAGDPPARRQVRELGNGPTDLALLASAMDRAARSLQPATAPSAPTTPRSRTTP